LNISQRHQVTFK